MGYPLGRCTDILTAPSVRGGGPRPPRPVKVEVFEAATATEGGGISGSPRKGPSRRVGTITSGGGGPARSTNPPSMPSPFIFLLGCFLVLMDRRPVSNER